MTEGLKLHPMSRTTLKMDSFYLAGCCGGRLDLCLCQGLTNSAFSQPGC